MNLKVLTLIILSSLFFCISINASTSFLAKKDNQLLKKRAIALQKSSFISFEAFDSDVFTNKFDKQNRQDSKPLALKADFWFAFFAIGSLASMWLIKSNKQ